MITEKACALCLLKLLTEYSDEDHIMPMRQIKAGMAELYGLNPDRRTIYSAVALLVELGYDISTFEHNGKGYFLREREFEHGEVRLLMDAVYSFPFLPAKHTEDLIMKLQTLLSVNQRKKYHHLTVVRPDIKSPNRQVFINIEILDEAISQQVKVQFDYYRYDIHKKMTPRREKKYVVDPYGMIFMNEHYYLICRMPGKPGASVYRLDRIRNVEKTGLPLEPYEAVVDLQQEVHSSVYAHTGKPETVTMICARGILDDVIDKFGAQINVCELDADNLRISFTAPLGGMKYWALQYLPHVEIISPSWLREEVIDSLRKNRY